MQPTTSYSIWFSNRNGSTLLCEALASTGIAGQPGEFFNLMPGEDSLCAKYGAENFEALKTKIWAAGTSQNGMLGIKIGRHNAHMDRIFNEILAFQRSENGIPNDRKAIWAAIFPNCQHIFLTRRNKVRQAVSWWKAIKDNAWHLKVGQNHENEHSFYEENYDFDALSHLLKETVLRECAIQAYFSENNISPLTVVYEDFVQNYEATIYRILEFLGINTTGVKIGTKALTRTATAQSEAWVQRFRKDLQKNMDRKCGKF